MSGDMRYDVEPTALEQRASQRAARRSDPGVVRREEREQLDQVRPGSVAVISSQPPHGADQPLERPFRLLDGHLGVGCGDLRVDIVGCGIGPGHRRGVG